MDTLVKHLKRQKGTPLQHPQIIDPMLRRLNLRGFHGWSPQPKCWRYTSKSLKTIINAKSHRSLFARQIDSQSCRPCIATLRPLTARSNANQPATSTCQSSSAIEIRIWRSFTSSANSKDHDPDPVEKKSCLSLFTARSTKITIWTCCWTSS